MINFFLPPPHKNNTTNNRHAYCFNNNITLTCNFSIWLFLPFLSLTTHAFIHIYSTTHLFTSLDMIRYNKTFFYQIVPLSFLYTHTYLRIKRWIIKFNRIDPIRNYFDWIIFKFIWIILINFIEYVRSMLVWEASSLAATLVLSYTDSEWD